MQVKISDDATESEAQAIAEALATHFEDDITLVVDGGETVSSATYDGTRQDESTDPVEDDLGPTEREEVQRE